MVVHACHVGEPAQADGCWVRYGRWDRSQTRSIGTVPIQALSHLDMDPKQPVPAAGDGLLLAELPREAIDAFAEIAGRTRRSRC